MKKKKKKENKSKKSAVIIIVFLIPSNPKSPCKRDLEGQVKKGSECAFKQDIYTKEHLNVFILGTF